MIGANLYLMLVLAVLADLPAMFLASYFPNKIGRRKSYIASYLGLAIFVLPIIFTPKTYSEVVTVRMVCGIMMKVFYVVSIDILIVWTLEIFPTAIRTQGLIMTELGSKIGSATASFIVQYFSSLNYIAPFLVMLIFLVLSIFLAFMLPETFKLPTREKFEDFFDDEIYDKTSPRFDDLSVNA